MFKAEDLVKHQTLSEVWNKLSEKQKEMLRRYFKTGNKFESHSSVYYPDGWQGRISEKGARNNAYRAYKATRVALIMEYVMEQALKKADVELEEALNTRYEAVVEERAELLAMEVDSRWVLKKAALLADFNIRKFLRAEEDGRLYYDFSEATDEDWYCVGELTVDQIPISDKDNKVYVDRIRLKSVDKIRALEMVGKHIDVNAFKTNVTIGGDEENPIQTITRRIIKTCKGS